jgi:hypothetical protein
MKLFKGNPVEDLFQYLLNGLERLSFDACVMFLPHIPLLIHDDRIGADGSNIHAQIK